MRLVKAKSHLAQHCVSDSAGCAAQGGEMGPVYAPGSVFPESEVWRMSCREDFIGAPCSSVNSSCLNLSPPCAYWLLCYYLAITRIYVHNHVGFQIKKVCAMRSLQCMPHFHAVWDSELLFFNHLGHNNFSYNPTLSLPFLQPDSSHLVSFLRLRSPLAPSLLLPAEFQRIW